MKTKYRIIFTLLFMIATSGFLSILTANAEEGTCILEANLAVFVIVWDLDDDGNRGPQIWEGRINQGQSAKITAPHGNLRYSYNAQPDVDQPLSGDIDRPCSGGVTILVP